MYHFLGVIILLSWKDTTGSNTAIAVEMKGSVDPGIFLVAPLPGQLTGRWRPWGASGETGPVQGRFFVVRR